jgi:ribosomal protein L31E
MKQFKALILGTYITKDIQAPDIIEAKKIAKEWVRGINTPNKLRVKVTQS